jgi:hypothetical protein
MNFLKKKPHLCLIILILCTKNIQAQISDNLQKYEEVLTSKSFKGRGIYNHGADSASYYISSLLRDFHIRFYKEQNSYIQKFDVVKLGPLDSSSFLQIGNHTLRYNEDFVCSSIGNLNYVPEVKKYKLSFQSSSSDSEKNTNILPVFWNIINQDKGGIELLKTDEIYNSCRKCCLLMEQASSGLEMVRLPEDLEQTKPEIQLAPSAFRFLLKQNSSKAYVHGKINEALLSENTILQDSILIKLPRKTETFPCSNIIGYLSGNNEIEDSIIVFSAHYDHLGEINGQIYPGADDNASGTSVLLEIARILGEKYDKGWRPAYNLVFSFFSAEEEGLLGSRYFVNHPWFNLNKVKLCINLDMVGGTGTLLKNRNRPIYLLHSDRIDKKTLNKIDSISRTDNLLDIDLNGKTKYLAQSDQYPFIQKNIPSLFFFVGTYPENHKPADIKESLDYQKMENLTKLLVKYIQ